MKRTILIVTGDGGESYETLYALHRFQEAGHSIRIAAPTKRRLNLVMHDFEPGWDTYIERPGYCLASDLTIEDVVVEEYDAILLLGGRAPNTCEIMLLCWKSSANLTSRVNGFSPSATGFRFWSRRV